MEPSSESESIWVLLTRHQVAKGRKSEYIALHVHEEEERHMDITRIAAKVC
jgi:calpain-7